MAELDIDTALSVLANPMRREILSRLVTETHYPLQLARELNTSQQAVMKHLSVLERHSLVESKELPSDAGGPPRKCYTATKQLSIRIDIGPNLFNAKMRLLDPDDAMDMTKDVDFVSEELKRIEDIEKPHDLLKALSKLLKEVNKGLANLESERVSLMVSKELLLRRANHLIGQLARDYDERRVLYFITDKGSVSITSVSERFNMRERTVEDIFFQLMRHRLLFDDSSLLLGSP